MIFPSFPQRINSTPSAALAAMPAISLPVPEIVPLLITSVNLAVAYNCPNPEVPLSLEEVTLISLTQLTSFPYTAAVKPPVEA